MPQITRTQLSRVLRVLLPQRQYTVQDLLHWLLTTQARNARAKRSHHQRRLRRQPDRAAPEVAA